MRHIGDFFELLKAGLEAERPGVSVVFGAEYFERRDEQGDGTANRVVVAEHTPEGELSTIGPPRHAHRVPADIGVERQWVTIECWAYDGNAPLDRAAQAAALTDLRWAMWRTAQAVVRANNHSAPGEPPGIYQATTKALTNPSERVAGKKSLTVFWIDFAIRELEPTTVEQPEMQINAGVA